MQFLKYDFWQIIFFLIARCSLQCRVIYPDARDPDDSNNGRFDLETDFVNVILSNISNISRLRHGRFVFTINHSLTFNSFLFKRTVKSYC